MCVGLCRRGSTGFRSWRRPEVDLGFDGADTSALSLVACRCRLSPVACRCRLSLSPVAVVCCCRCCCRCRSAVVGAGSARSFDLACCLSLQEQRRFGLTAESLLFDWSKRSNQEKTTPRPRRPRIRRSRFPAVLAGSRPLRNSRIHALEHARFPLQVAPLLGAPEGPPFPSTRLPAWSSRRAYCSMCSARVESEAIEAQPSRSRWPAGPA